MVISAGHGFLWKGGCGEGTQGYPKPTVMDSTHPAQGWGLPAPAASTAL